MNWYYVSCEFNADDEYEDFAAAVDKYPAWQHVFGYNWFICSKKSAEDVYNNLVEYLFEGDSLFVTEIGDNYMSLIPEEAVEWIERNVE